MSNIPRRQTQASTSSTSTRNGVATRSMTADSSGLLMPSKRRRSLQKSAPGDNAVKRTCIATPIEDQPPSRSSENRPEPIHLQQHTPAWKSLGLTLRSQRRPENTPSLPTRATSAYLDTNKNHGRSSQTAKAPNARANSDIDQGSANASSVAPVTLANRSKHLLDVNEASDSETTLTPEHCTSDVELFAHNESSIEEHCSTPRPRRRVTRPSYAPEPISDDSYSEEIANSDGRVSESDRDSDFEDEVPSRSPSMAPNEEISLTDSEEDVIRKTAAKNNTKNKATSKPKAGKDFDYSLPPIDNIEHAFEDMASNALKLGLEEELRTLGNRPLNIATMCSGTESPLIALGLLSKGLEKLDKAPIHFQHLFSAEIDPIKQAYIERNFRPAKLFRDVREFIPDGVREATTAYGAEEAIPQDVDILIAGFVCKDLSKLHNHGKGLDENGESGDTWQAIYSYAKSFRPKIILIENVRNEQKLWDSFGPIWDRIGYEYEWMYCDTKNYYIPQTRNRMYMIAIERSLFGIKVKEAVEKWKISMQQLQRQCSSPCNVWLASDVSDQQEYTKSSTDYDWGRCKLRHDSFRSEYSLGNARPITRWHESGTLRLPDHANHKWYHSQTTRVHDCIDIAHLQRVLLKGYDSLYKMAIWDVSQNVDRLSNNLGILPCITPSGCFFVTNKQTVMTGSNLLVAQGMPSDKLLFAKETPKELQNLAGNAMSTTVIGAALVAAIMVGHPTFREDNAQRSKGAHKPLKDSKDPIEPGRDELRQESLPNGADLDLHEMMEDAKHAAILCACEGTRRISKWPIQMCTLCGHTACSDHAGNPRHSYGAKISSHDRKQTPGDFEGRWRPLLPPRLRFSEFPTAQSLKILWENSGLESEALIQVIEQARLQSKSFILTKFQRLNNMWKIWYESSQASLELIIASHQVQWLLHIRCPPAEPGNSALRKILEQPLARGRVSSSLLDIVWDVHLPIEEKYLQITFSEERTSSYRSRLGLPEFEEETVSTSLYIKCGQDKSLTGVYSLLSACGTAMRSLYRRASNGSVESLYLFLDPDPVGPVGQDSFVFSSDCYETLDGNRRQIEARLDPAWRPWNYGPGSSCKVYATMSSAWVREPLTLEAALPETTASIALASAMSKTLGRDCFRPSVVLEVELPEKLQTQRSGQPFWAIEQAKRFSNYDDWQQFGANPSTLDCKCSPPLPQICWSVNSQGSVTPQEDRKAAATFERTVKTQAPIIDIHHRSAPGRAIIQLSVNHVSLAHRARRQLENLVSQSRHHEELKNSNPDALSWRLVTNHVDPFPERFNKFLLQNNTEDTLYEGPRRLKLELLEAQEKSLAWMMRQELGKPLQLVEVEEAVHAELGWRAEAKAEKVITVRGGVLADLPSFGKTVTTIALINSELEQFKPEILVEQTRKMSVLKPLIAISATLVVCPPHIARQWKSELEKFLDKDCLECYNVRLIEDFSDLQRLSIEDIECSRVIIASWKVLADDAYITELARFAAMPLPMTTRGRPFEAWLDHALKDLSTQINNFRHCKRVDFWKKTDELLKKRLAEPGFKATVPSIKPRPGSKYQPYATATSDSNVRTDKVRTKATPTPYHHDLNCIPLLHLFNFNRVIIDEYHYLYDSKNNRNSTACASVKGISAPKRWVLSGTPALSNFTDVNQIASFLGVKLGRDQNGDGVVMTELERKLMNAQTEAEKFRSRTETKSYYWHEARHKRAQEFLDMFVRRNEPSLQDIVYSEYLRPIELGAAHHAAYLELSQCLLSHGMEIKRFKSKPNSDRYQRICASLEGCKTAEEALLKFILQFIESLDISTKRRQKQLEATQEEHKACSRKLRDVYIKTPADPSEDLYLAFKRKIGVGKFLDDDEALQMVRRLNKLVDQEAQSFKRVKQKKAPQVKETTVKDIAARLDSISLELQLMIRSKRFVTSITQLLPDTVDDNHSAVFACSSTQCKRRAKHADMFLISQCGHMACKDCLAARTNDNACVCRGCGVSLQTDLNLIKATDLGHKEKQSDSKSFGKKLDEIIELIKSLPRDDQGIVFVPNDGAATVVEEALIYHRLPYHSLGTRKSDAAKKLEDFKTNRDPKGRKKVLVLNLLSELAAGANLVNANHVIFVSPLLVKDRYQYESAMAQAIARCRRFGQEKKVQVYHFAALRTIDVDILEHFHRRSDAIHSPESRLTQPRPSQRQEKTRMIRTAKNTVALVPKSWLSNKKNRKMIQVGESPETFTSLISFAETFESGDQD